MLEMINRRKPELVKMEGTFLFIATIYRGENCPYQANMLNC
ncbi:hypothetical protein KR50_00870 [Jeotgalibacillus campisalis]|uniref:Uncharacterized protein n=1 Tax=Jeotgalibacillus campisalis TaxID=220754 RepID=A0A0C2W9N1_9BACL|nr:hypothetical protein KR50_00870 [Jeotgalibacillus campisalis]